MLYKGDILVWFFVVVRVGQDFICKICGLIFSEDVMCVEADIGF